MRNNEQEFWNKHNNGDNLSSPNRQEDFITWIIDKPADLVSEYYKAVDIDNELEFKDKKISYENSIIGLSALTIQQLIDALQTIPNKEVFATFGNYNISTVTPTGNLVGIKKI